jgi:hypothetical protein
VPSPRHEAVAPLYCTPLGYGEVLKGFGRCGFATFRLVSPFVGMDEAPFGASPFKALPAMSLECPPFALS